MKNMKEIGTKAFGLGRNVFLAGLGIAATANDRGRDAFEKMVEKGAARTEKSAESPGRVKELGRKLTGAGRGAQQRIQTRISTGLTRFGIPTRSEVLALTHSVEQLTEKVQGL